MVQDNSSFKGPIKRNVRNWEVVSGARDALIGEQKISSITYGMINVVLSVPFFGAGILDIFSKKKAA